MQELKAMPVIEETKQKNHSHIILKIIGALAALFAVLSVLSFRLKTVCYAVYTDKISNNLRVAQISDLHSCRYGKNMSVLVSALDDAHPDVVVLTGDIYDNVVSNANTRIFLEDVSKKYPCYYVSGNHELWSGKIDEFVREMQSMGITVLEGDDVTVDGITLCGAAVVSADGSADFRKSVEKCAENAEGYSVLLAHYPEQIDYYRSFGKFDLVLSGHAHGGQWRVPYLINGIYAPGQGLFPEYAGGRYDFDDCTFIVSRGLSRTKEIIPRIFNNPELVIVDICGEGEEQ